MHPSFATDHLRDEAACVETLLASLNWDTARAQRIDLMARDFVRTIRDRKGSLSEIETFLEQYPLSSPEGLALMTLAEALLRIPDTATADALIAEKMDQASWDSAGSGGIFKLAGVGLGLAQKTLGSFLGDIGRPVIRKSMGEAVRRIGRQFVLGENIATALSAAKKHEQNGYRLSFDMLGEGARTAEDAERYTQSYLNAAEAIGRAADAAKSVREKPGMSVKLSALHPRYHWTQQERCVPELIDRLTALCRTAARYDIAVTVDAEEADRLEMAYAIIAAVAAKPELKGWDGFGLAVQAYEKRTFRHIDALIDLARAAGRHLQVRLVKGAYWDTEIKRAQIAGLPDYPVFTRKANTDVSYLACAKKLLAARDTLYPMFATHNAHTAAAVLDLAGNQRDGFEFQRLYGMGETLGDMLIAQQKSPVTIYAPVGSYEDLLPYLVRRMLENGANTSFVNQVRGQKADQVKPLDVIADPVSRVTHAAAKRHQGIPLPPALYRTTRRNSAGLDVAAGIVRDQLTQQIPLAQEFRKTAVTAIINGNSGLKSGAVLQHNCPALASEILAEIWDFAPDQVEQAIAVARSGFADWSQTPAVKRALVLRSLADLLETHTPRLVGLLQHEAGKTLTDALGEIREAVDFCRYYAEEGENLFGAAEQLPGPTGEENVLSLTGRGVFVCISPWNFPLAIFLGQIAAALMAGNSVIAKPAEQTPVIAFEVVNLMLLAGVPRQAITLLPGDGCLGAALVAHPAIAGVAFTGSIEVARSINRTLAAKDGPIVPLIAETGGQNAMIVDATALPEQVVDDVVLSAFGSAGQRCSALRVLYVQDDIAARVITLLQGAMAELNVGDNRLLSTDIGPVIDAEALKNLQNHEAQLQTSGAKLIAKAKLNPALNGTYFAPAAYEITSIKHLTREVFGPILHVIRFKADQLDKLAAEINATGFGLTFGLHSRLHNRAEKLAQGIGAGNIYINRSMIGAVVGVQPFGGQGLSGTGPKAGGPYYLHRFATEKTVSVNTTATGGNIALISTPDSDD